MTIKLSGELPDNRFAFVYLTLKQFGYKWKSGESIGRYWPAVTKPYYVIADRGIVSWTYEPQENVVDLDEFVGGIINGSC